MKIEFSIPHTKANNISDNPYDPFDTGAEFYHTYQLCELESLTLNANSPWAKQGFSLTGAPDDGVTYSSGSERNQTDLAVAFDISKKIRDMADDSIYYVRMDIHTWESDSSTFKVRSAFTDSTLSVLMKAWDEAKHDENESKKRLEEWLSNNREDLIKSVMRLGKVSETPWVSFALGNVLPLFNLIVEVVKNNSDDYLWAERFVLEIKKDVNGIVTWRINKIGNVSVPWSLPGDMIDIKCTSADKIGKNELECTYRFSVG